jgi:hypothetical protein
VPCFEKEELMKRRARIFWMALAGACLAVTPPAHTALLDGQTVAAFHLHQTAPDMTAVFGPIQSVVGPNVEYVNFGFSGFVNIDVTDTRIVITLNIDQPAGFADTLIIADANGTIPAFTSVTVNPLTNYAGFDASRVSLTPELINLNLTALNGVAGQQIVLDLTGAEEPPPPPQPQVVDVDIQPGDCSNVLRTNGFLQVAIRGSASLDVSQIDPASVRLQGVAAVRSKTVDAAGASCDAQPDGLLDLVFSFRSSDIVAALAPVTHGETRLLTLTGQLKEEFGGTNIQGEDSVVVRLVRGKNR